MSRKGGELKQMKDEKSQRTETTAPVTRRVPEHHGGFRDEGLRSQAGSPATGW